MRISDWSSDVCSSDLELFVAQQLQAVAHRADRPDQIMAEARDQQLGHTKVDLRIHFPAVIPRFVAPAATGRHDVSSACTSLYTKRRDRLAQIGRASCRERVCQYV